MPRQGNWGEGGETEALEGTRALSLPCPSPMLLCWSAIRIRPSPPPQPLPRPPRRLCYHLSLELKCPQIGKSIEGSGHNLLGRLSGPP